jgi:hypothetical protein
MVAGEDPDGADPNAAIAAVLTRIEALREQIGRFAGSAAGRAAGLGPVPDDPEFAGRVGARLESARTLPALALEAEREWPAAAADVLPLGAVTLPAVWGAVLASIALEAIGATFDRRDPDGGSVRLFDRLSLREAIAHGLERLGAEDDEPWRSAARIRATFAHPDLAPGDDTRSAVLEWLDDPDAAWAAGAHEHDGARYLVREPYERLLWWMTLRALLESAPNGPNADRGPVVIADRLTAAERAGWRIAAIRAPAPDRHQPA